MRFPYLSLLILLFVLPAQSTFAANYRSEVSGEIVIMKPTGKTISDLPEMVLVPDTSSLYKSVMLNINDSFIRDFIEIYFIAGYYLKNKGKLNNPEPAYLALTGNQGGYAKTGFTLTTPEGHISKPQSPYVDITVDQATSPQNRLMSFTQLYPHELGHVIYHMISPEDSLQNNTKNVDIHFFSVITDYSTAFNEGFAEHIENVSRIYEKNDSIKAGIFADIEEIGKRSKGYIEGFGGDFKYPWRLGYYKASMLIWYQNYEDYKRYEQAMNRDIRFLSREIISSDIEDQLTYRNSGVILNRDRQRNTVQLHSTEGVVSSFFTHLTTSDLKDQFMEVDFYTTFLKDTTTVISDPEDIFTPLQNQFIKYFTVLHNYVVFNNSSRSQLIDFIEGYMKEFPSEADEINRIYYEVTGVEYNNYLPPPLWLLIPEYEHRLLVFDPFDAITVPVYTFDLNAAESADLQTIPGISDIDAGLIVNYRRNNGYFTDFEQIKNIEGLSDQAINNILDSEFDQTCFEEIMQDFEPKLSINSLLISPLLYIFSRAGIYFLVIFTAIWFLMIRKHAGCTTNTVLLVLKYLFLNVLLVIAGLLAVVLFESPLLYIALVLIAILVISVLIYRKNRQKLLRTFVFVISMGILILASVF